MLSLMTNALELSVNQVPGEEFEKQLCRSPVTVVSCHFYFFLGQCIEAPCGWYMEKAPRDGSWAHGMIQDQGQTWGET